MLAERVSDKIIKNIISFRDRMMCFNKWIENDNLKFDDVFINIYRDRWTETIGFDISNEKHICPDTYTKIQKSVYEEGCVVEIVYYMMTKFFHIGIAEWIIPPKKIRNADIRIPTHVSDIVNLLPVKNFHSPTKVIELRFIHSLRPNQDLLGKTVSIIRDIYPNDLLFVLVGCLFEEDYECNFSEIMERNVEKYTKLGFIDINHRFGNESTTPMIDVTNKPNILKYFTEGGQRTIDYDN